jgi:hypothetical protein
MIDLNVPKDHNALAWAGALGDKAGKLPGTTGRPKLTDLPPDHPSHTPASAALSEVLQRMRAKEHSEKMMQIHDLLSGE